MHQVTEDRGCPSSDLYLGESATLVRTTSLNRQHHVVHVHNHHHFSMAFVI